MRAVVDGRPNEGLLATGLVAGRIDDIPSCAELIERIERDARARIAALSGAPAGAAAAA
jgi:NAD(P)H-dependent flavin oxidoreductase YrpB (nitropropane dioxygenase family)